MQETATTLTNTPIDIVAIIGLITGVLGFGLSLLIYFGGRVKLKIEFPADYPNFFFDKLHNYWYTITDKQAIIYIRFINNSNNPLTIYEIETFINNTKWHFNEYGESTINNPTDDTYLDKILIENRSKGGRLIGGETFDMRRQITLPLLISPYGVSEGYMFYEFFPNIDTDSVNVKFKIKTSRKIKSLSTVVEKYQHKGETEH